MYGRGLKDLGKMSEPEFAHLHYLPEGGKPVPLTLKLYHELVASLELEGPADLAVHPHFDVARYLLLYGWCESSFTRAAELHAFGSLELGLRLVLRPWEYRSHEPSLGRLLPEAIQRGLIADEHIRPYPRITGFGQAWTREHGVWVPESASERRFERYVDMLSEAIPALRNRLAHGDPAWVGTAFATLSTCRDLLTPLAPFTFRG